MKHEATVVMLPTKDKSWLFLKPDNKTLGKYSPHLPLRGILEGLFPQYLYTTVSQEVEPILDGEWYIDDTNTVRQALTSDKDYWKVRQDYVKIIATTDMALITPICIECKGTGNRYSGKPWMGNCRVCEGRGVIIGKVPQIHQSFIKEYCDKGGIGKVMVEYEKHNMQPDNSMGYYEPGAYTFDIKPKLNSDNTVNISSIEEKMYSKEEVEDLINKHTFEFDGKNRSIEELANWNKENL